jgi:hypothetical protein
MAITHGFSSCVLLPCLYTFVEAVCYCHVCIPSFKPCAISMFVYLRSSVCYCHVCRPSFESCVIAMFVYLPSSRVLFPCWYTFVQTRLLWPSFYTSIQVLCFSNVWYKHGNNTRLERRYTNMGITHSLNEGIQTRQ